MLVGAFLSRPMHSMARESLFRAFGLSWLLPRICAHPVRRGASDLRALKEAIDLLKGGACLLVFPEGTRSRDGSLGAVRSGVAFLARRAGVPVVPALVEGTFRAWPRHRALPLPAKVEVFYEPPIEPTDDPEELGRRIEAAWSERRRRVRELSGARRA